jgi:hypothetical protein
MRRLISFLHSAKGLEWSVGFVIWAVEGKFPSARAYNNPNDLEEEWRLMVCGHHAGQDRLMISYPGSEVPPPGPVIVPVETVFPLSSRPFPRMSIAMSRGKRGDSTPAEGSPGIRRKQHRQCRGHPNPFPRATGSGSRSLVPESFPNSLPTIR